MRGQDFGEPGFRVDVVESCRGDEGKHDGGAIGAALGAGESPVAPSQSNAAQRSFGCVVAEADPAVVDEAGEVGPALEHVVDRLQDLGGAREGFALTEQPGVHVVEKRFALLLAHGLPLVSAAAVDSALDLEQRVEAPPVQLGRPVCHSSCPRGHSSRCRPVRRSPAAHGRSKCRRDRQHLLLRVEQRFEAIVAVGLQDAGESGQMLLRVLATPVARGVVDCRRWCMPTEGPIVPHISPDAPGRALALGQDADGGVVAMKALGREDMALDQLEERHDGEGSAGRPEIDPLDLEARALAVEWSVHAELVEENGRQQLRTDEAARRDMERRRRLADLRSRGR